MLRIGLVAILLVLLGVALLYGYKVQSPAAEHIALSGAIAEVQQGRVRAITISADQAMILLADGRTQFVSMGEHSGEVLLGAVAEHDRGDPSHAIEVRYEHQAPMFGVGLAFAIAGLLPLLFIVALILFAAYVMGRSRAGRRYELLARMADLRDRGALTEEEFQCEKARALR